MAVNDAQVRKLMKELSKGSGLGHAAMKAGMDRGTARKYAASGKLPSEMTRERTWRTRQDPFAEDWPAMEGMLSDAPELEAKALFEHLLGLRPDRYDPGQLRTFQRRVKQWRALAGPDKEVFFAQVHRPGEALQTDFTWATELGVTIAGEPLDHKLCHVVLPYSNWQWATVCRSESLAALRRGLQAALMQLGKVPQFHQTDNSTAATHDVPSGKREFNASYVSLIEHYGMTPRTTAVGAKEQNGDVESLNGALKRRLKQHLLLRGHADFDDLGAYEAWLHATLRQANALRDKRFREDLAAMRPIVVRPLPEYTKETVRVTSWSTIRIKHNTYSVPSRLIDEHVQVRIFDDRLEVYYGGVLQVAMERLLGRNGHRINYRHIIWSLVRKPGAFARYRYRADLFPSLLFRRAYDMLCEALAPRQADIEYLRILFVAATTMQADVEVALELLLEDGGQALSADAVKGIVGVAHEAELPAMEPPKVDLSAYDGLVPDVAAAVAR